MNRDSNGFITTDSELLGFEVPVLYSGASGINVDNENYVISFTGTAYGSGGKTYQGVAPIVVNNDEDKISANTTPFGVQSPLYFAQDDESGCVIGFSGDIDPAILSAKLDSSAFEAWQTGQYTNDIATITNNVSAISSEIPDVSNFITNTSAETTYQPIGNYATQDWVSEQGYITGVNLSEYAKNDFVLSSIESSTSSKLDVSSFASVSGDFLTTSFEIPESASWNGSTYITQTNSGVWNNVTGKQDTLSFHYLEI